MKNTSTSKRKKHMAVAAVVCSLAVCTMTGCTGKATEQEAAQAVSTENTTEGTILTAEDIKASGQNASASADVDEVADHPAGEKSQEKEDSVPESGNTQSSAGSAPSEQSQTTETQGQSGSTSSISAAPAETAPSLPAVQEQTTVQVPVENQQSQTTEPQPATCTHNWQPVTHEQTVCTQPEYYEQIVIGGEYYCLRCGIALPSHLSLDGVTQALDGEALVHLDADGSRYGGRPIYDTIHHDAVYVTETVTDYYQCTGCRNIITEYEYEHPETIPDFVSFN